MFVAKVEWKYPDANEIIACSEDKNKLIEVVVDWAMNAYSEGWIEFKQLGVKDDMSEKEIRSIFYDELIENELLTSDDSGTDKVQDWVEYSIENVREL